MAKHIARYSISFGLAGCYMPDSISGPYCAGTRKELANIIREQIEMYDLPKTLFAEVKIRRLWQFIARNGSSVAHFSLNHKANALSFHGLTSDEADQMDKED